MLLRKKRTVTCTDSIDDETWSRLSHDEARLFFVVERRQLGRSTLEQYEDDLAGWRHAMKLGEKLRQLAEPKEKM